MVCFVEPGEDTKVIVEWVVVPHLCCWMRNRHSEVPVCSSEADSVLADLGMHSAVLVVNV
eukprot:3466103-Ditylum_brightwellii.AAC.1